jgi:hypothetical protein
LLNNYTRGYSGYCWGCNYPWGSFDEYKIAFLPSVVVTSVIIDGIYEYYQITQSPDARDVIISSSEYIIKDIPITSWDDGLSFAYTHISKGVCYNASLHAVEVLARAKSVGAIIDDFLIKDAVSFIIGKQKKDGSWYYSLDTVTMKERRQIDFHQGFILVSLHNIIKLTGFYNNDIDCAINNGLYFYWNRQFTESGRSLWRLPKKYPIDIHNQSQGIITFSKLSEIDRKYLDYAKIILAWTIQNMQHPTGYFYYRIHRLFKDKTPYIRWGQAWMLLGFSEYFINKD